MVVGMMSWQWVGPGETKFGLGSLIFIRWLGDGVGEEGGTIIIEGVFYYNPLLWVGYI
jgi:hypothetical protein